MWLPARKNGRMQMYCVILRGIPLYLEPLLQEQCVLISGKKRMNGICSDILPMIPREK